MSHFFILCYNIYVKGQINKSWIYVEFIKKLPNSAKTGSFFVANKKRVTFNTL